ncbi:response regulator [Spirosoma endophyticum]|uniref:Response regulatory domain-containing protein n=1 Tax=Spirosoma endophyticum TaxID=662367 RepID=A0A1I2E8M5_9BACT|nr:response regulator [Spirosoma endophyticum]SFE89185.1 hypothetical protein SAMN05216167_12165 [Spirosoma endophyticum]
MNIPKLNNLETLTALTANPLCQHIPAVNFSTDAEPPQVATTYRTGASRYLAKPAYYSDLDQSVKSISCYFAGLPTDLPLNGSLPCSVRQG